MRLVITSDWHIGLKDYATDRVKSPYRDLVDNHVAALIRYGQSHPGCTLIDAGDSIESASPSTDTLYRLIEIYVKLKSVYKDIYVLLGNHNGSDTGTDPMVFPEYLGIHVIRDVHTIGNVTLIPHLTKRVLNGVDALTYVDKYLTHKDVKHTTIIGHFETTSGISGVEESAIAAKAIRLPADYVRRFRRVILGHYHTPSALGQIIQIGSAVRTDFAECSVEKRFIVYDTDSDKIKSVSVPTQSWQDIQAPKKLTPAFIKTVSGSVLKVRFNGAADQLMLRKLNDVAFVKVTETVRREIKQKVAADKKQSLTDVFNKALDAWLLAHVPVKYRKEVGAALIMSVRASGVIDTGSGAMLTLQQLSGTNWTSYKDLDLTIPAGLVGIIGVYGDDRSKSNGAGKSSLVDAILFALYGSCRSVTNTDLVTAGQTSMSVTLTFGSGDAMYTVRRTLNQGVGKATLHDKSGKLLATGSQPVTEYIRANLVKADLQTFLSTRYFGQDFQYEFVEATSTRRLDYLREFFGLNGLDKAAKESSTRLSEIFRQIAQEESTLQALTDQSTEAVNKLKALGSVPTPEQLKALDAKVTKLKEQYTARVKELADFAAREESILRDAQTRKDIDACQARIARLESGLKKDLPGLDPEKREVLVETLSQARAGLGKIKESLSYNKGLLKSPSCPLSLKCPHLSSAEFVKSVSATAEDLESQAAVATVAVSKAQKALEAFDLSQTQAKAAISADAAVRQDIVTLQGKIKVLKKTLLSDTVTLSKKPESAEVLSDELDSVTEERERARAAVSQSKLLIAESAKLKAKVQHSMKLIKSYKKECDILSHVKEALGRDGLVLGYVDEIIKLIQVYTNAALEALTLPYSVELGLAVSRGTSGVQIRAGSQGSSRDFATYSKGERGLLNLALRMALTDVLCEVRGYIPSFLILDEVLGSLDSHYRQSVMQYIVSLADRYQQVLFITHTDMRDATPHLITVCKTDGVSRATVTR